MKRAIMIAFSCIVAALLPASVAVAGNGGKSLAAKACAAEKKGLKKSLGNKAGKNAFSAIYGKQATRNCIKGTRAEIRNERANAQQECRAERDKIGTGPFAEKYGKNEPRGEKSKGAGRNAFGKCVSGKVKNAVNDDVENTINAARACRAERDKIGTGPFAEKYGTNEPKGEKSKGANRNAFGKCVSRTAKNGEEEEQQNG